MTYGLFPELDDKRCYYWPLRWRNLPDYPYIERWLKQYRKEAVKDQEHFTRLHKEFKDKIFKEEARHYLRIQRVCTLMLGYIGEGKYIPSTDWPEELAPELDEITQRIEIREMKSYYRIDIRALQNGYKIEANYKVPSSSDYNDGWRTRDDEFVFTTWDQVQEFIKNNVLEIPPKDITD